MLLLRACHSTNRTANPTSNKIPILIKQEETLTRLVNGWQQQQQQLLLLQFQQQQQQQAQQQQAQQQQAQQQQAQQQQAQQQLSPLNSLKEEQEQEQQRDSFATQLQKLSQRHQQNLQRHAHMQLRLPPASTQAQVQPPAPAQEQGSQLGIPYGPRAAAESGLQTVNAPQSSLFEMTQVGVTCDVLCVTCDV